MLINFDEILEGNNEAKPVVKTDSGNNWANYTLAPTSSVTQTPPTTDLSGLSLMPQKEPEKRPDPPKVVKPPVNATPASVQIIRPDPFAAIAPVLPSV